ncbi:MAG: methanogen output domain 1-containing protein [Candidatus Hodarchaeota archaeon]
MVVKNKSPIWSKEIRKFLEQWFSSLMEGIEQINDSMWPEILAFTEHACAHIHLDEFKQTWEKSEGFDDFLLELNKLGGEFFEKINENQLKATYTKCTCPFVQLGFINSPILCNCSPNWLAHKFEVILGKNVEVITEQSILRGAETCRFTILLD